MSIEIMTFVVPITFIVLVGIGFTIREWLDDEE